ncbi:MAG TPA: 6-phosphogluconolactonase [Terrimesophilobacter sp.]|nr:6-phosphogluconolactonase [Terrimesophilobacter sp.]HRP99340.1 6-phosphogluconolactonase [Terrimesophilobacter sp.]
MNIHRTVVLHHDRAGVVNALAARIEATLSELLGSKSAVHLVLTGGTVGIDVLAALGASTTTRALDWSRIHVWWGDERWLPAAHEERNDHQADEALLSLVDVPAHNVHRFASDDGGSSLDDAAAQYTDELATHAPRGETTPVFDILLLGVGPDAHIASLFPDGDGITESEKPVVAVRESPKPPPERLSLTLPSICRADRVWLALAGGDKASALSLALSDAHVNHVPVAGARGRLETVFFVDADAAADVPAELIAEHQD